MKVLMSKTFTKMFKVLPFVIISILSGLLGFLFSNIYENLTRNVFTQDIKLITGMFLMLKEGAFLSNNRKISISRA